MSWLFQVSGQSASGRIVDNLTHLCPYLAPFLQPYLHTPRCKSFLPSLPLPIYPKRTPVPLSLSLSLPWLALDLDLCLPRCLSTYSLTHVSFVLVS